VNLNLQRYTKLLQQREYRLEWAEKIGMGFELPKRSTGLNWTTSSIQKHGLSLLESGGREGIRTLGLLVANEAAILIRHGAATA
jgi:hypothetical protein